MKLLYAHASPYARKCRITAIEKSITNLDELEINPYEETERLAKDNPLGKIPCLVLSDGQTLFDSTVICAYFDQIGKGRRLLPTSGEAHWQIRRHEAVCNGIMDAAFNIVTDTRKPAAQQSAHWQQRWQAAIQRSLALLENEHDQLEGEITASQIALGAALGYLDFRLREEMFLSSHTKLTAWFEQFEKRQSMQQTQPK